MTGLVVDNYFFGVAAVSPEGDESPVVFPVPAPVEARVKALVTGAAGFIGRPLGERLAAEGFAMRALVRGTSDDATSNPSRIEVIRGDMRNRGDLERATAGCDLVFHLAVDRHVESIWPACERRRGGGSGGCLPNCLHQQHGSVPQRKRCGLVDESTPIGKS